MKKIFGIILLLITLTGCGEKTINSIALNFEQNGDNYELVPDQNAQNYHQLITDFEDMDIELNADTPVAVVATSTANILDELGMNIVGVTNSDGLNDNLQAGLASGDITGLGSPMEPNLETLKLLNPDIVFVGSNMPYQVEYDSIDNLITLPQELYYDIYYTIWALITEFDLGEDAHTVFNTMVTTDQEAKSLADSKTIDGDVAALKYAYENITIAPSNTYVGSLLTELGIDNMYGDYTDVDIPMSKEQLLLDDPDYIVVYGKGEGMEEQLNELISDPDLSNLTAYKNDHIYILQSISLNADIDSANTLKSLSEDFYGE